LKKHSKKNIAEIKKRFIDRYSASKTELEFTSDYELLTAIILSAQCTDKRVNIITKELFAALPTVEAMAASSIEEIASHIKSCSFFNAKAKNLLSMAQSVVANFGGSIPHEEDALKYMAVDTHVFRTSHRLGLSTATTATKTEEELSKTFVTELAILHQAMVLFGRYICKAKNPLCDTECFLVEFCRDRSNFKPQ